MKAASRRNGSLLPLLCVAINPLHTQLNRMVGSPEGNKGFQDSPMIHQFRRGASAPWIHSIAFPFGFDMWLFPFLLMPPIHPL